jgi:hypothetical protein
VHIADAEAGDLVVGVADDVGAERKNAHVEPVHVVRTVGFVNRALLARGVLHAFADQHLGLRMQPQRHAQRRGRALARVVVGRGADAAGGEHDVARGEGARERFRDAHRHIADVLGPGQLQAARGEQLDHLGHVLVGTLARQDFVTDDDKAE